MVGEPFSGFERLLVIDPQGSRSSNPDVMKQRLLREG